jgi:hypothetical protein
MSEDTSERVEDFEEMLEEIDEAPQAVSLAEETYTDDDSEKSRVHFSNSSAASY